ncbi:uncharacterized protein LOC133440578 [Cololabis saira]|uniref:uncharacterized protein LOC133440578 n=1 Tax=Cololabis saira TaxID=129043 RepID=UPI002AD37A80|nr:uncharacterized protein LOC133440578 [Cololabis saira]
MVQQQLNCLQVLRASGFGQPFPCHGLQLLFWFANDCVTVELQNFVQVMKLVSDCEPETGVYGFHFFGNMEELLPVLKKSKKSKNKTQFLYFEVGNLNTRNYPASADLPAYVRENHGNHSKYSNTDRLIIRYQKRSRVVETLYVTEHDYANFSRFRADRTHEISSELIRALQNPQLDIDTFLFQMDYCKDMQVVRDTDNMYNLDSSVQLMLSTREPHSTWKPRSSCERWSSCKPRSSFKPRSSCERWSSWEPRSSWEWPHYRGKEPVQVESREFQSSFSSGLGDPSCPVIVATKHVEEKEEEAGHRALRDTEADWGGFDDEYKKKRGGGGFGLWKILLAAGALYVAVKCLRWWLRGSWDEDFNKNLFWIPRRTPTYPRAHVMLDYVY